jgi:hypothetical protein
VNLQPLLVGAIVGACALHVAWRLLLPTAVRARVSAAWRRRLGRPVPASTPDGCSGCGGCAEATQPAAKGGTVRAVVRLRIDGG